MPNKIFIGLDPGIKGGITILDREQNIIDKMPMPIIGKSDKQYDIWEIYAFIARYKNSFAILEKAQPQFRDGSKQAFKTGYGYGVLQAILTGLQIPFQIIAPKVWQKKVFDGLHSDDTKAASILFCKRKWPSEDWTATERSRKPHDGMTDAACMAYYGVRTYE